MIHEKGLCKVLSAAYKGGGYSVIPVRRQVETVARSWRRNEIILNGATWAVRCLTEDLPKEAAVQIVKDVGYRANDKRVSIHKPWFRPDSIMGFPVSFTNKGTWCQKLKTRFLERPDAGKGRNIVEYLGIAADEPKRFGQLSERKRAPLVEFGIEEELCGLYCKYNGILSPSYETSCRDGCWMCHNQGVNQLRQLRKNYPNLWALLLRWDADSPVSFKPDGRTVHDYDWRFQLEDEGCLLPDDKTFRWKLLDSDMVNTRIF